MAVFDGIMPKIKVVIDEFSGVQGGGTFAIPRHDGGSSGKGHRTEVLARACKGVVI